MVKPLKKANPMLDDTKGESPKVEKKDETQSPKPEVVKKTSGPMIEEVKMPSSQATVLKPSNSSASLSADQRKMKTLLENQPKFTLMIPLEPGEKQGSIKDVWLNGFHVEVPKGILVKVPQGVFEVLAHSLKLNSQAGAEYLVSRDSKVEDALAG